MRVRFAHAESVAAAVALLTACGKKSDGEAGNGVSTAMAAAVPAGSATVVKIGHAALLTEPIAHLGNDNENGARLAVEQINAQGRTVDDRCIGLQPDARHGVIAPQAAQDNVAYQATNDRAVLTKISSAQPDGILSGGMNAPGEPFTKQAAPGIGAQILGGDGVCTDKVGEPANLAAQNLIRLKAGFALSTMDKGAGFEKKSGNRIHMPARIDAPFAYDALHANVDAMKRARSIEAHGVLAAMSFTAIAGEDNGASKEGAITLYDFKDGKKAVLDAVKM
ncbi:hypothetical protein [Paraburkholderia flava]|uniref:hypothetical protein n=1 Tax=Paraburkholderia flava TaxID=2547393 RepID=UPI00105FD8DF|nr:hypothetical protein [Paraburkholderia flava]